MGIIIKPVSYTHLDVYKRQVQVSVNLINLLLDQKKNMIVFWLIRKQYLTTTK